MEQTIGFGIALGVLVGFGNERVTRLWLSRLLRREMAGLLPFIRVLVWSLFFFKHAALWITLYLLFSRAHFNLLGFAVGILLYQVCRLVWMFCGARLSLERG